MDEELCLPRLGWDPTTETFSGRKRILIDAPSSDPIFSSDDDPSVDNYTSGRTKKRFRGPWYQQKEVKRTLQPVDSGVFLGSDGTDVEFDTPKPSEVGARIIRVLQEDFSPEALARKHVDQCLETGSEKIDLSCRCLTELSNDTVKPLSTFTIIPFDSSQGESFRILTPRLNVFLYSNQLTRLPGELFRLETLNVLSVRNNRIRELPSNMEMLLELVELNVAYNRLRFLPFELLRLFDVGRLHNLQIHPNPFFEPEEKLPLTKVSSPMGNSPLEQSPYRSRWNLEYQCRTPIRFLDNDGALLQGPEFGVIDTTGIDGVHSKLPVAVRDDIPVPPAQKAKFHKVPSLLETILRSCSLYPQLPHLASFLPPDAPPRLRQSLEFAEDVKQSGGRKCTICGAEFVMARTEWIEWWEITKVQERRRLALANTTGPLRDRDEVESAVPFIRRGCSWKCTPGS